MAANPVDNLKEKPNKVTAYDMVESLEDYFEKLKKGEEEIARLHRKLVDDEVKNQKKQMERAVSEWINLENEARLAGAKELEKFKKDWLKEQAAEERKEKVKLLRQIAASEYGIKTKDDEKRRKQDLVARKQENKDQLEFYEKLAKKRALTEDELLDKKEKQAEVDEAERREGFDNVAKALGNLADKIGKAVDEGIATYSQYQTGINARLQGAGISTGNFSSANYFGALEERITSAVGITPYFKTETMLNNLQALVEAGIASNLEQRAFIQTAKDSIATTFDTANASLLRIIRLQQRDSTAARIGMESYLTRFLNELVANTEYLNSTFDTVSDALVEASSQMSDSMSAEFEYAVQKWLGALSGVGLSESTATNLAQALGYLGSGNIEALNSSNLQNLLVMAASRSNLSYAELLSKGLTADTVDQLMSSLVRYMVEISGSESNVVRSQFAQTFGLSISDLKAARNIESSLAALAGNRLSYEGMYSELSYQLGQIPERLSLVNLIDNLFENLQFGTATSIATSPALLALWKVNEMIEDATGGINIPFVSALGTGVDVEATVNQLAKLGLVGVGSLGMIGDLISGINTTFDPSSVLGKLSIYAGSDTNVISRGTGIGSRARGRTTSVSTFVGNKSGSAIYEGTMAAQAEESKQKLVEAREEAGPDSLEKVIPTIRDYLTETLETHMKQIDTNVAGMKTEIERMNESTLSTFSNLESIMFKYGV